MLCGGIDLCGRDRLPSSRGSAGYFSVQSVWRIGNAESSRESRTVAARSSSAGVPDLPQPAAGTCAEGARILAQTRRHATVLGIQGPVIPGRDKGNGNLLLPVLGIVLKIDEGIAIVDLDIEETQQNEAQEARHFGADAIADGLGVKRGHLLVFLAQIAKLKHSFF